jgi:leucyl aminopeptidase
MSLPLPAPSRLSLVQRETLPRQPKEVEGLDHVIVLLPESARPGPWPAFPHSKLAERRYRLRNPAAAAGGGERLLTELEDEHGTRLAVAFVAPAATTYDLLCLGRKLADEAFSIAPRKLGLMVVGLEPALARRAAEAVTAALLAADVELPSLASKPKSRTALESLAVWGAGSGFDAARALASHQGNALARWLTTLPTNLLTPATYLAHARTLAKRHGWTLKFHDEKALQKRGAGAFLAVCRGSATRDAGIIELNYRPKKTAKGAPSIALVGKGVCFDTGGSNLKSAKGMLMMHGDMQGSAVALGTLLALTELGVDFPVMTYLGVVQNRIGPESYLPSEVVTAADGTTIEVVHTDAEGRMVLADTLAIAAGAKPGFILDFATLTGACHYALGDRLSGAFTNRAALNPTLIAAGESSGERIWPFPMHADYDELLESKVADIKQCLIEGEADHILAARFLSRFAGQVPWVHLDLSAADRVGGLGHVGSTFTGFGVRVALDLLLDRRIQTLN